MTAKQMRRGRADAPLFRGTDQRFPQRRMLGEAKIVVAGKVDEHLAVDLDARAIDCLDLAQAAQQILPRALGLSGGETFDEIRTTHVFRSSFPFSAE